MPEHADAAAWVKQAPPTQPGALGTRPSTWPTVIAVLCIIWAVLGLFGSVWSLLAPLFYDLMASILPQGQSGMEAMKQHVAETVAIGAAGVVLGTLLLVGGAGLLRRRHWSRVLLTWWSVVKIVVAMGESWVTYLMQREQMQITLQQQAGPKPPAVFFDAIAIVTLVMTFLFTAAFPVFLLIWFRVGRFRSEVDSWKPPAAT